MDIRLTRADCDEAGDFVVPNVLGPRDLVSRLDNMGKTVLSSTFIMSQAGFSSPSQMCACR